MSNKIRFQGRELDVEKAYVDAEIVGFTDSGEVEFTDGSSTWTFASEELERALNSNGTIKFENVDEKDELWSIIDALEDEMGERDNSTKIENAIRDLFEQLSTN